MGPDELELAILGIFFRAERYDKDRAPNRSITSSDPTSGLPISANDLAPRSAWITGTELAMSVFLNTKTIAPAMIHRITLDKEEVSLSFIEPTKWTAEEADAVSALESGLRRACIRLAQRGLIDDRPVLGMNDGERMQVRDDGSPISFKCTYKGLVEARQRVRGTRYDRRGPSVWDCMSASDRVKAKAQWASADRSI